MRKKILVIEDNPSFRKLISVQLEKAGYGVVTIEDGLQGLNAVRKENPDLVILDIMLPGMNGHQICRMIKFDQKMRHIPVIISTSRELNETVKIAKECGANAFIAKNKLGKSLLDVVKKLLPD